MRSNFVFEEIHVGVGFMSMLNKIGMGKCSGFSWFSMIQKQVIDPRILHPVPSWRAASPKPYLLGLFGIEGTPKGDYPLTSE
jgi:hypothetical protein